VHHQAEAVNAARTSYDLAQRQLDAENARFEQGISTNFQVLEYQQQLSQAKANLVTSRVSYAKARTALVKAEGLLDQNLN
jgi:outer membrane protein TolC